MHDYAECAIVYECAADEYVALDLDNKTSILIIYIIIYNTPQFFKFFLNFKYIRYFYQKIYLILSNIKKYVVKLSENS